MTLPRLAVTMGDPAGIGPEITAGALADFPSDKADIVIVGDTARLRQAAELIAVEITHVIRQTGDATDHLPFGEVSAEAGKASSGYVQMAVRLALAGEVDGIVTAPDRKSVV